MLLTGIFLTVRHLDCMLLRLLLMLIQFGVLVPAAVLSFGLANRINIYRQEKDAAQLAITQQRIHIAQDLHDSVTQSLYSANLFAEAGREIAEAGDVQSASHYFRRIGATTQQALKEMRLFLYELRPPDVVEFGSSRTTIQEHCLDR